MKMRVLYLAGTDRDLSSAVLIFFEKLLVWPEVIIDFLPGEQGVGAGPQIGELEFPGVVHRLLGGPRLSLGGNQRSGAAWKCLAIGIRHRPDDFSGRITENNFKLGGRPNLEIIGRNVLSRKLHLADEVAVRKISHIHDRKMSRAPDLIRKRTEIARRVGPQFERSG